MANKKKDKDSLPGIEIKKNSNGEIISYKFRCCVGRDDKYKQIWRTTTISKDDPRIEGKTPAALKKELQRIKTEWDNEQKEEYNRTHSKIDKSRITVVDFINSVWFPDHVMDGSHSPNSIEFYRYMSTDISAYFGNKKLKDITAEEVKKYIKYLNTEAKTKTGEPYSNVTIIRHYQTLRNILNYALRFDYIKDDPCKKLSVKDKPHKESKKIDFLPPKDATRYIQALEKQPLYWRCMENIMITCGLRRGEVAGLKYSDIDSEKLTISISRSVGYDKNSPNKIRIGSTKTGKSRTVSITPRINSMIESLKTEQEKKYGATLLDSNFIFCNVTDPSRPLMPTDITRWQRKFVERNHLPDVSPHDLRHTAASLALESGSNLKDVQELLGHQDPETTAEFYAAITEEAKRRTVSGIESLLIPQKKKKQIAK